MDIRVAAVGLSWAGLCQSVIIIIPSVLSALFSPSAALFGGRMNVMIAMDVGGVRMIARDLDESAYNARMAMRLAGA